jgi:futalosine hydrolase
VFKQGAVAGKMVILRSYSTMEILLVSATLNEVKNFAEKHGLKAHIPVEIGSGNNITLLVTGVGMINTTYHLTKALNAKKFDLVLNAGICGSFDRSIQIGELVQITEDRFSELGAEDKEGFLTLAELSLADANEHPFSEETLRIKSPAITSHKHVKAITVNKVHGSQASIARTFERFSPQVESMEGAAVMFTSMKENIPVLQFRSASNYVEPRNREAWNIPLALKNLDHFLNEYIPTL